MKDNLDYLLLLGAFFLILYSVQPKWLNALTTAAGYTYIYVFTLKELSFWLLHLIKKLAG